MQTRGNLADRLLGKHRGTGKQKLPTHALSRRQRLAIHPKLSRRPALEYLRYIRKEVLGRIQGEIERRVIPLLPSIAAKEERPIAHHGVRLDTGPSGYEGNSNFAQVFEGLGVTVTEVTRDPRLLRILRRVADGVDQSNASELAKLLELNVAKDRMLVTFLDGFIRDNVALITSIAQEQLSRVQAVVTQAVPGQKSVRTLATEIRDTFGVSDRRAALIARDQTLKVNGQLTQLRQTQAGVTEYIWSCSNDERVRGRPGGLWEDTDSNHWALEGTRQSWSTPPVTNEKTGATNHPGQDYQCRCVALPVLDNLL